jgi:hypothetical protein
MNTIIKAALFTALVVMLFVAIELGIRNHEKHECLTWIELEEQGYKPYWATWEVEQCKNYE